MNWPLSKLQKLIEERVEERSKPILMKIDEVLVELRQMNETQNETLKQLKKWGRKIEAG